MDKNRTNIVIVGGTIAGMMAAIEAVRRGAAVELVSAAEPRRSSDTILADGIAAVIDEGRHGDSIEAHVADTIRAGDFLADQRMVRRMCESAPGMVRLLTRMGVLFNRTPEGNIAQVCTAGSSFARTAYADAAVGQQVVYALDEQLRRLAARGELKLRTHAVMCALVQDDDGACRGVVVVDRISHKVSAVRADAVIMCTGGYAGLFASSASAGLDTGAEIAQAYRQGAALANPEFVQFHPHAMRAAERARPLSELAAAFGAKPWVTFNERTWHFMDEMYPSRGALVPDDIATRAVFKVTNEMKLGEDGCVFFDLSDEHAPMVAQHIPRLADMAAIWGERGPHDGSVAVGLAAHRSLGGLFIDEQHMTTMAGLFAAGACAPLYHGTCALGSNVILADLHGGEMAGAEAAAYAEGLKVHAGALVASMFERAADRAGEELSGYLARAEGENPRVIDHEMLEFMARSAGVNRDNDVLDGASAALDVLAERCAKARPADRGEFANDEVFFIYALARRIELAQIVVRAAQMRNESRGCHFKTSFPQRDDKRWGVVTRVIRSGDEDVIDHRLRIDAGEVKPAARSYE